MARDGKSVLTLEKRPPVAELKLKTLKITQSVTFSIGDRAVSIWTWVDDINNLGYISEPRPHSE